jgi:hypothetical protein
VSSTDAATVRRRDGAAVRREAHGVRPWPSEAAESSSTESSQTAWYLRAPQLAAHSLLVQISASMVARGSREAVGTASSWASRALDGGLRRVAVGILSTCRG